MNNFAEHINALTWGKSVCILGFGREGRSTYAMLTKYCSPSCIAIADLNNIDRESAGIADSVELICGEAYQECLDRFDIVFKSPGIVLDTSPADLRCQVTSETQVFFEVFREQIIGITGTKGKSTVTSMIYHILKESGKDAYIAGNIGMDRYIFASTGGVYPTMHTMITEDEFRPESIELKWGERDPENGFDYDTGKRQAECAAVKLLPERDTVMVRLPVVIGENDYLRRLLFYVEHVMTGKPMYIANPDVRICYISQSEAGGFFADILRTDLCGAVNASSIGSISPGEFIAYAEGLTGRKAVLSDEGDPAPYNGFFSDYTLDTRKAESSGIEFQYLGDWIYSLIGYYADGIAAGAEL